MMGGYAANFAVYTMAMVGLIVFALFVYKKFTNVTANKSDFLGIEDRINLAPRLRMSTVYAISQSNNGRVANTCNLSEDWVGYSTRYGDSAGDVAPLAKLTVEEVRRVGIELGLPRDLVYKTPSDGLCGKTDEDNLGFLYSELDRYIRTGEIESEEKKANIDRRHKTNLFKLEIIR